MGVVWKALNTALSERATACPDTTGLRSSSSIWLARHRNVHFHFTPTHASWLNQVECWLSILSRQALRHSSFLSPRAVRDRIERFIATYNTRARPFRWRATEVHPSRP